jgi:hypothetical protein
MKLTIEELRKKGWIAYEYRRGSHMYHLNTETSDIDTGGVFICPQSYIYGLRSSYPEQVSDEKNDTVFYEFGRWIELLLKSNPTALESLFAPEDCIIGDVHPAVQYVLDHKWDFVSKECFKTFYGYAVSQIGKARGLNKKIVNPVTERKDILDFCYTFKGQGSQPIKEYLKEHKLDQKYCGLVKIPNMCDGNSSIYGVYYDFAAYFKFENIDWFELMPVGGGKGMICVKYPYSKLIGNAEGVPYGDEALRILDRIEKKEFFGYSGIVHPDEITRSNEVRLSSVPKGERQICFMTYNKNGYESHCRDYKEYKEWEEKRNPVRYEGNLGHNYDAKNVMHCMRLVRMAKELAQGKGFNVVRDWDRQYLLDIRNHKFEYEDVMEQLEKEKAEMEDAIKSCTLPDKVDIEVVNKTLIEARKSVYEK